MESVIQVEGLSKKYTLGIKRASTLREVISGHAAAALRRLRFEPRPELEESEFWALKDISFNVKQGEVLGIIGRNGAGKSTLLKILSRITDPTHGKVSIHGRVASLLEVGTGFHPELSGRDNIFLNGAILGLSRREIAARFDEIVAFSEIERFIDTPVKHYSSGMYVRLAFAVAAHLEPEILIIDEVLAVGDTAFQKKCIGKIQDISKSSGRTVLFISHDMSAISALSQRCLLLEKGNLVKQGPTSEVVAAYYGSMRSEGDHIENPKAGRPGIVSVALQCSQSERVQVAGQPMSIRITLQHPTPIIGACLTFQIVNQTGQPATHLWIYSSDNPFATSPGFTTLECKIPKVHLNVGDYSLKFYFSEPPGGDFFNRIEGICPFQVIRTDENKYWGWRPEACVYHEDTTWSISQTTEPSHQNNS